jgi:protein-S-isoprenylcysteine O-methyltransferase Ste14
MMETFLKYYLPVFVLGFIVLVFVVPSIRVYKQTGVNPFRFKTNTNQTHDFVGATMKVFILLIIVAVVISSFFSNAYPFLTPFTYLETTTLKLIGFIIGHLSLVGIMIAQWQMNLSWRIGIDYENKTSLVNKGLFSFSRNPIYLFLLFALTGLFLILPNAVTFAVLFAAFLVLHIAIRLEEEFLQKQHGEAYQEYMNEVPRLI